MKDTERHLVPDIRLGRFIIVRRVSVRNNDCKGRDEAMSSTTRHLRESEMYPYQTSSIAYHDFVPAIRVACKPL